MNRILLLAALVVACSPQAPGSSSPDTAMIRAAAATITATDVHDRIAFLASDEMRGRDTPSPGLEAAAQWIADELASFELEPAGDDGWLQRYPYPLVSLDPQETQFTVVAGATHSFQYGREFFAWRGAVVPNAVGAVYAGSEIVGEENELRDRAVIVRLEGGTEPGRSGLRLDQDARQAVTAARERARRAGASAVVFVLDEQVTPAEMEGLAAAAESSTRTLGGLIDGGGPLPAFFITRATAHRTLGMAGLEPDALLGDRGLGRPLHPVPLPGLTLRLAAPAGVTDDARPPNVVGVLRGSDPELRDTYVVLSAHMDHTGVGRPDETGDSIYNGADDNASGTSVLVEVAEAMARLDPRPRRSVLFLAVSGEEKGLLGSRWFSDNPTVPLEAIVANINIDMVGRNAPDSIVVIGQDYSTMGATVHEMARRHADELGLTVSEDLWPEQRFFFRSDHFNFARKEVPALFFFAGTHDDYHRPGDELEKIDTDKTSRVGRLVFYLTHALAESATVPEWDPEGLETVRRLVRQ